MNCKGYLWVNAISIGQKDLRQKSQQILLMGEIYRNAKEVLVWLGDEKGNTDSKMAVDLLKHLNSSFGDFADDNEDSDFVKGMNEIQDKMDALESKRIALTMEVAMGVAQKFVQLQTVWINITDFFSFHVRSLFARVSEPGRQWLDCPKGRGFGDCGKLPLE
jgi:hypothetical protein